MSELNTKFWAEKLFLEFSKQNTFMRLIEEKLQPAKPLTKWECIRIDVRWFFTKWRNRITDAWLVLIGKVEI